MSDRILYLQTPNVAKPGEIPVWRQPTGAQNAYSIGDYESTVDNNVWEPGVYGWSEVE